MIMKTNAPKAGVQTSIVASSSAQLPAAHHPPDDNESSTKPRRNPELTRWELIRRVTGANKQKAGSGSGAVAVAVAGSVPVSGKETAAASVISVSPDDDAVADPDGWRLTLELTLPLELILPLNLILPLVL